MQNNESIKENFKCPLCSDKKLCKQKIFRGQCEFKEISYFCFDCIDHDKNDFHDEGAILQHLIDCYVKQHLVKQGHCITCALTNYEDDTICDSLLEDEFDGDKSGFMVFDENDKMQFRPKGTLRDTDFLIKGGEKFDDTCIVCRKTRDTEEVVLFSDILGEEFKRSVCSKCSHLLSNIC